LFFLFVWKCGYEANTNTVCLGSSEPEQRHVDCKAIEELSVRQAKPRFCLQTRTVPFNAKAQDNPTFSAIIREHHQMFSFLFGGVGSHPVYINTCSLIKSFKWFHSKVLSICIK
jgi:hypothetical protein